ncbi:MAG: hypothetical protein NVS3B11_00490 [Collimonas sp.]
MPYFPEQIASVIRANAMAQHAITTGFNDKLIKNLEDFSKLNVDAVKATLTDSAASAEECLKADSPQDFFALNAAHIKRDIQNSIFYYSEVTRIASAMQLDFNKTAGEKIAETSRNGTALLTELSKNLPVGVEKFLAMLKPSMDALDAAHELAKKMADGTVEEDYSSTAAARQMPRKRNSHQSASAPH